MIKPNYSVIYRYFLKVNFYPLIADISPCKEVVNDILNAFIMKVLVRQVHIFVLHM